MSLATLVTAAGGFVVSVRGGKHAKRGANQAESNRDAMDRHFERVEGAYRQMTEVNAGLASAINDHNIREGKRFEP